ncbi:MAG: MBOAT family protein [Lachnospiraceae bacterium]|nr:MBOAT family protein [Lachnospiraceae bacterium]
MIFSSAVFLLLFLPIVFVGNLFTGRFSNFFLLLASLLFYAWGEPYLVLLLIFSILLNWSVGLGLTKTKGKARNILLISGIVCDLGILCFYKFTATAMPVGLSFFTFQALSYIIDIYKGNTKASRNPVNTGLYISFFPQLIAGPIVRYRDINRQIESRSIKLNDVSDGFKRFIYGLGKKVLIADVLGSCADHIYAFDITTLDTKTAWIGALTFTLQIYYDFSGYSDMAVGLGKMFGFTIPENFSYPYLSRSISEFWRRWHISLGSWFREYVYIPLGGSRKGTARTCINLLLVFILTGLWHGADLSFVIWGLFHCSFIIFEKLGLKKLLDRSKIISVVYTFFIVIMGWVMFRARDTLSGLAYISRMVLPGNNPEMALWKYMDKKTVFVFICALLGMGIIKALTPGKLKKLWDGSVIEALYCVCILLLCLASIAADTYNPFIYFQF